MHYWAIVPAAGSSRRMGAAAGAAAVPKQYLTLAGRSVLEWSLEPFLQDAACRGIVVVLAADDMRWPRSTLAGHPRIATARGGAERADSVRSGLAALRGRVRDEDWVLVHDAARPCLSTQELQRLCERLQADEVGGLLAAAIVDTVKRSDESGRVLETLPRSVLWRALTPQMFRCGLLQRALELAVERGLSVSDEAQALEALGLQPRLVPGDSDNIKITVPADLQRAERILAARSAVRDGVAGGCTAGSSQPPQRADRSDPPDRCESSGSDAPVSMPDRKPV